MTIETSISYQVVQNIKSYFQCVHHRVLPGKHFEKLSQVLIELMVLIKWIHTTHREGFQFLNEVCTRNTLLKTKDKIHDTGGKTGAYVTKFALP